MGKVREFSSTKLSIIEFLEGYETGKELDSLVQKDYGEVKMHMLDRISIERLLGSQY